MTRILSWVSHGVFFLSAYKVIRIIGCCSELQSKSALVVWMVIWKVTSVQPNKTNSLQWDSSSLLQFSFPGVVTPLQMVASWVSCVMAAVSADSTDLQLYDVDGMVWLADYNGRWQGNHIGPSCSLVGMTVVLASCTTRILPALLTVTFSYTPVWAWPVFFIA